MRNQHSNHQHSNHQHRASKLTEGLERGDLSRLVHLEVHVDEFKSKMGNDEDIAVISFKIGGKEPAVDLVNFIEKGYDWVIDADTSAGEMEDGDYIVFVEIERTPKIPAQIIEMIEDMVGLTDNPTEQYRVRYHKSTEDYECNLDTLRAIIPLTPKDYLTRVSKDQEQLDKLKAEAGVKIESRAPKNSYTDSIRVAAGIL